MTTHVITMDTPQRDYIRDDVRRLATEYGYTLHTEESRVQWRLVKQHPNGDVTEVKDHADLPLVLHGFLLGIESASMYHE